MTHHEHPNVTVVREGFEAFKRGDMGWMDQHLADDVVWHVGGTAGGPGPMRARARCWSTSAARPGDDRTADDRYPRHHGQRRHVMVLGTASASAADGSGAEWRYVQIFHIRDGKATEVWGMAENDAAVDPFLDSLPD
jgi:uncharacterized protein